MQPPRPDPNPDLPFTPPKPPLAHQAAFLRDHGLDPGYALFWEQGLGKTYGLVLNGAQLAAHDLIDGVLVVAPNGVHFNWHKEELPTSWPADHPRRYLSFCWDTQRAANKSHAAAFLTFLEQTDPTRPQPLFGFLLMSYEGMLTDAGKAASWEFMRRRRILFVLDESQRIKTPQLRGKNATQRTVTLTKAAQYAAYRRIASGTPIDTPLDVYSQVRWIDPTYWERELALGSWAAFRAHYGEWRTLYLSGGREVPQLVGYRHVEELEAALGRIGSRVLKSDALDLPPKTYKRAFHPLSPEQRRVYGELRSEALSVLQSGETVTVAMAMTLHTRLRQVCCGFITPAPGAAPVHFTPNPRADLLRELLRDTTTPAILWGRFVEDVRAIEAASRAAGRRPVVYDGQRPHEALDAFRSGQADDIVANLSSNMTEGVTLTRAKAVFYYSNLPKLITRLQSEDRAHRIGQTDPVLYVDLLAEGTRDAADLAALQRKRLHAGAALGDNAEDTAAFLTEGEVRLTPRQVLERELEESGQ